MIWFLSGEILQCSNSRMMFFPSTAKFWKQQGFSLQSLSVVNNWWQPWTEKKKTRRKEKKVKKSMFPLSIEIILKDVHKTLSHSKLGTIPVERLYVDWRSCEYVLHVSQVCWLLLFFAFFKLQLCFNQLYSI